jgi:hypothetical protein
MLQNSEKTDVEKKNSLDELLLFAIDFFSGIQNLPAFQYLPIFFSEPHSVC